ncbi:MAG TPA: cell division protein FtsA [Atopostipes sp.]|nr:cell division protein FtsA [Atopostipes sp.]
MKSGIYASLDIGTTSIKVIAAEVLNGQINVIGVGNERSNGLSRGMIVDIDQTAQSIQRAVEQAEDKADIKINELIVGIPANDLHINSCYGSISINQNHQEIADEDVQNVVEKAIEGSLNQEREVLNVTLEEFVVDGFDGIKDPRGMIGNRIEFRGTITSIPRSILHNIRKAVQKADYGIKNIILQPHAMAQIALSEDERNFGAILIDMGGGQTSLAVIHEGQVKHTQVISEGGEYVTKDISIVLNTSIKNAEKLKRDVGHAYYKEANPERTVSVEVVGQNDLATFKEAYIAEVIEARIEQIFEQLKFSIDDVGAEDMPAGIVISGGTASLPGIDRLAEDVFNVPVRIYIPDFMGVRYPAFTNAIGLVMTETRLNEIDLLINQTVLGATLSRQAQPNQVKPAVRNHPVTEEQPEETKQQTTQPEEEKEPFSDKLKNFFSGFFE